MTLLNGIKFYYKCDEGSGTRVDSSVNGLNVPQIGNVPSTTGILNLAVDPTGNTSNRLEAAHNNLFRVGDNPFTISWWQFIATGTTLQNHPAAAHWANTSRGWLAWWRSTSQRFRFSVSSNGTTTAVEVDWSAAVALDTWHHIIAFHDPDADLVGISVNRGTFVTAAFSGGIFNSTAPFGLGHFNGTSIIVGLNPIDEIGAWDRLLTTGEMDTLFGGGTPPSFDTFTGSSKHVVDNFQLETGSWRRKLFAGTIFARSADSNVSGYVRQTIQPKDDSSSSPEFVTRRVRNYYTIPPSDFFQWYRMRVDMSAGETVRKEDGLRYYERLYKTAQSVILDGPSLVEGTLKPTSFIHPDSPRADETLTFSGALPNLDSVAVEFFWMPTFSFADLADSDFEIARFSADVSNYLVLTLIAGERYQREYSVEDVFGPGVPIVRLQKVRASSITATVDIPGVYFGYPLGDPSIESMDDILKFSVVHQADGLLLFRVSRNGHVGSQFSVEDPVAFGLTGGADVVYNGQGWYGQPVILKSFSDEAASVKRRFNAARADVLRRTGVVRAKEAALAGEKDPYRGQVVRNHPYLDTEDFNRADDPNLGDDWTVIKQTGNGFNIISNQASCAQEGFEYWANRRIVHADFILQAQVGILNDSDVVGVLGRFDRDAALTGDEIFGYGAEIIQTAASAATLRLVRWHNGNRTVLASAGLSAYTAGTDVILRFLTSGTSLSATAQDLAQTTTLASIATTDDVYRRPGRVGIYGQTGGAGQFVTVDNWDVEPNFQAGLI